MRSPFRPPPPPFPPWAVSPRQLFHNSFSDYSGSRKFSFQIRHVQTLQPSDQNLRTPAYSRHLIITDSFLCPWGMKALTFSLNSTRLIQTLSMDPQCPY